MRCVPQSYLHWATIGLFALLLCASACGHDKRRDSEWLTYLSPDDQKIYNAPNQSGKCPEFVWERARPGELRWSRVYETGWTEVHTGIDVCGNAYLGTFQHLQKLLPDGSFSWKWDMDRPPYGNGGTGLRAFAPSPAGGVVASTREGGLLVTAGGWRDSVVFDDFFPMMIYHKIEHHDGRWLGLHWEVVEFAIPYGPTSSLSDGTSYAWSYFSPWPDGASEPTYYGHVDMASDGKRVFAVYISRGYPNQDGAVRTSGEPSPGTEDEITKEGEEAIGGFVVEELLGNSAVQVLRYWRDDVVISNPKLAVQSDRVWMGLTTYEKDDDRWGDAWCPEPSIIDDAGETLWSAEACGVLQGLFTLEDEVLLALIAPPTSQQGDPFRLVRVSTNGTVIREYDGVDWDMPTLSRNGYGVSHASLNKDGSSLLLAGLLHDTSGVWVGMIDL